MANRNLILHSRKKSASQHNENLWGYFFIAPALIIFLVFYAVPIVMSLYYSLTRFDGISEPVFIGLLNYMKVSRNREFWLSLGNTFCFTAGTVIAGTIISLFFAVLLNKKIRGRGWFRAAFFLPYIVSYIAAAMVWQWMYQPDSGIINMALEAFGITPPLWLGSTTWAMIAVIVMSIWKTLGFNLIILLSGLQSISAELYEAAALDGATQVQSFFKLTVPLLKNTVLFVVLNSIITGLQAFDQIYIMTGGGPLKSTQTVVYLIYQNSFLYFKQGYASAMSYVLFAVIFAVGLILLRVTNRRNEGGVGSV